MGRKGYPAEFRRRALDLVAAGKTVAEVARLLEVSDQSIYAWRQQELIDRGELPGLSSEEREELRAAADPRTGDGVGSAPAGSRVVEGVGAPKRRFEAISVMAGEGLPVEVACRVLGVCRLLRVAVPTTFGSSRPACVADGSDPRDSHGLVWNLRRQPGARRARSRPRHPGRPLLGRAVDAARPDPGSDRLAEAARDARRGHGRRPRRPALRSRTAQSAVGGRHHRAPDPRGQGLLRGRARRLQPPRGRLVDQPQPDRGAHLERARDGR